MRDLSDDQWEVLDTLIPEPKRRIDGRGRPWKSRRSVVISPQATFVLRLDPSVPSNLLAWTFMSVGGSLPFIARGVLSRSRLLPSIVLTIIGSGLGALLLLSIPLKALRITIPVAMIGVAVFSLLNKNLGRASQDCEHVA